MGVLEAVILGLIQGLTEFLPVSSDGHLALGALLFGEHAGEGDLFFDLVVHLATMLAVIVHFRRDLWQLRAALARGPAGAPARRVVMLVVAASVPTAIIGLAIKDAAERAFGVPVLVGVGFLLTSAVLGVTTWLLRRGRLREAPAATPADAWADLAAVRVSDAVLVGVAQGLAPWPGLSRSGSTIAAGVARGIPPATAARFSLLVSLPAIGGAFLLQLRHAESFHGGWLPLAIGFAIAGVVGYLAIGWLIAIARRARLGWFALYTAILGTLVIVLALAG